MQQKTKMDDRERALKNKIKRNRIGFLITAFLLIVIAIIILTLVFRIF